MGEWVNPSFFLQKKLISTAWTTRAQAWLDVQGLQPWWSTSLACVNIHVGDRWQLPPSMHCTGSDAPIVIRCQVCPAERFVCWRPDSGKQLDRSGIHNLNIIQVWLFQLSQCVCVCVCLCVCVCVCACVSTFCKTCMYSQYNTYSCIAKIKFFFIVQCYISTLAFSQSLDALEWHV